MLQACGSAQDVSTRNPKKSRRRGRRSLRWPARGVGVFSSAPRLAPPGCSTRAIILALRLRCGGLLTTCCPLDIRTQTARCRIALVNISLFNRGSNSHELGP